MDVMAGATTRTKYDLCSIFSTLTLIWTTPAATWMHSGRSSSASTGKSETGHLTWNLDVELGAAERDKFAPLPLLSAPC